MNKLRSHKVFFIFSLTPFLGVKSNAQTQIIPTDKQEIIDELLTKKMSQNNQFSLYTNYSVQLKNGTKEEAEELYKEFRTSYPDIDATIIFGNPKFKLIVGNFKHKIEAEHLLRKIQSKYPEAFVVKLKQ